MLLVEQWLTHFRIFIGKGGLLQRKFSQKMFRENEEVHKNPIKPGTVKSEQILIIRELFHSTTFTCHANNSLGSSQRAVHVIVKGILKKLLNSERTNEE